MQFFYHSNLNADNFILSSEESKHCAKALRKSAGSYIFVTDGRGTLIKGELLSVYVEACTVQVVERMENYGLRERTLHLGVAPTKNPNRMEWLVEKCVEIGIEQISFVRCAHSERPHLDLNRMERLAVSAMKQSNTTWLPKMEAIDFQQFIKNYGDSDADKLIAWCDDKNNQQLINYPLKSDKIILLVGPEGDFSKEEIAQCSQCQFTEIKLGNRRLRTETAALYGCVILAGKFLN
ncbi:MAG: 16S rRNA (uracil(1498)-N(3))-methyltransferase [Bacteroidales bacterium]|jgi:16S rRNA (uracil1498-N3)-methyltransferase|nr:16S rRNA (uracil(1498)-N(3))-methyltransferase [Bacteroidales bacterium]